MRDEWDLTSGFKKIKQTYTYTTKSRTGCLRLSWNTLSPRGKLPSKTDNGNQEWETLKERRGKTSEHQRRLKSGAEAKVVKNKDIPDENLIIEMDKENSDIRMDKVKIENKCGSRSIRIQKDIFELITQEYEIMMNDDKFNNDQVKVINENIH